MNLKLTKAIEIFKELGWNDVEITVDNVLELPLGTPQQKKEALAGLKSGEWGRYEKDPQKGREYYARWVNHFDVDAVKVALFAIRVGIDYRRVTNIFDGNFSAPMGLRNFLRNGSDVLLTAIAGRGENFVANFINHVCASSRRFDEHGASTFGGIAVILVHKLNIDIPQNIEYLKDWARYSSLAMEIVQHPHWRNRVNWSEQIQTFPSKEMLESRFAEHVEASVALGVPATGPLWQVILEGVSNNLLARDRAMELSFIALDTAVRPGDRKALVETLDKLQLTDEEICQKAHSIIPLLSLSDTTIINRLAPTLIAHVDESLLAEVISSSLSTTVKKTRTLVLKSAMLREVPANIEELEPWLNILSNDGEKTISNLAKKLTKHWDVDVETFTNEATEIQGMWQATPDIWKVPHFEPGDVTTEALTDILAILSQRKEVYFRDMIYEEFLVISNALASNPTTNPEVKMLLKGLNYISYELTFFTAWAKGDNLPRRDNPCPLEARSYACAQFLGMIPCLLSTPSYVDYSITLKDLVERIEKYEKRGVDVLEPDLFLAITRLDISTVSAEYIGRLNKTNVTIKLLNGKKMGAMFNKTVSKIIIAYLEDGFIEPPLVGEKWGEDSSNGDWIHSKITIPNSLKDFPPRLGLNPWQDTVKLLEIFPAWGDVAFRGISWCCGYSQEKGIVLRQAVKRAQPLPPVATINMFASLRSSHDKAAEDANLAIVEAWERGLLRPNVADIKYLDWTLGSPSNLAALANVFESYAPEGMLSVIWPILDDLISVSAKSQRLLTGTAELVNLVAMFLPEVQHAIGNGLADPSALELPGVRALAKKNGSSKAVTTAKEIVKLLPPLIEKFEEAVEEKKIELEIPFDKIWQKDKKELEVIEDGCDIKIGHTIDPYRANDFLFALTLPSAPNKVYHITNTHYYYDLTHYGHAVAFEFNKNDGVFERNYNENRVYLHWDKNEKTLKASKPSNKSKQKAPLSVSILTVCIGLLASEDALNYNINKLISTVIKNGSLNAIVTKRAMGTLLQNDVISPLKLSRILEKNAHYLHVLWPILTESIKSAGEAVANGEKLPKWLNRILDITIHYAPYLKEAMELGLIPVEDAKWTGLEEIASVKQKSTAVAKAREILELFLVR